MVPNADPRHLASLLWVSGHQGQEALRHWPEQAEIGVGWANGPSFPSNSVTWAVSITKAQTYPNPLGPGCREDGDPGANTSEEPFVCCVEWRLAGTLASTERASGPDRLRPALAMLPPLPAMPSAPGIFVEGGQSAQSQPVCLFPASPGSLPLQPPLLRCVRAWGLRSHCLAQTHITLSVFVQ